MKNNRFFRNWHRRLSVIFVLPLLLVSMTGVLLSIRSFTPAIQPPNIKLDPAWPTVNLDILWERAKVIPQLELQTLNDLKSVEVKVTSGTVSFRAQNGYEVVFNAKTGEIAGISRRWTPLLVKIHEGGFLPEWLQRVIFIPLGLVLIFLCFSGVYLFIRTSPKR